MKEVSVNGYFCHDYFRRFVFNADEIIKIASYKTVDKIEVAIKELYLKCADSIKKPTDANISVSFFNIAKGRQLLVISFEKTIKKLDCYAVGVVFDSKKVFRYLTVELAADPVEFFVNEVVNKKANDAVNIVGEWTKDGKHFNRGETVVLSKPSATLALMEEANKK